MARTNHGNPKDRIREILELESIYNSVPVGLCVFDDQLRYLRINERLAEINGVSAEKHMGRTPRQIIPDLADQAEALHRQIMETGEPVLDVEVSGTTAAQPGVMRTWIEQWIPLKDAHEEIIGINVVAEEITKSKKVQEALKESEEKYRSLVEQSLEGLVIAVGPPPKLVFTNPSFATIFGYTVNEVLAMSPQEVYEMVHPHDQEMFFGRFANRIAGKLVPSRYEVRGITKDKRVIWLEISSTLINYLEKPAVQAVFTDITERKRAEKKMQETIRQREEALAVLDAVFDAAPIGIGFWDRDLKFVRLNQALAEINGLGVQEQIGKKVEEVVPDLDGIDKMVSAWQRIIETGEPVLGVELSGKTRASGEMRYWLDNWYPVRLHGEIIGIAATVMDITDRKHLEEKLRQSRDELEHRVRERTKALEAANEALRDEVEKRIGFEKDLRDSTKKVLSESKRRRFLSARLVDTLERDRRDVAMYLHDQIGQVLASTKMELEVFRQDHEKGRAPSSERLVEAEKKIADIMGDVREVSRRLRPDVLDTLGLLPALRSLVENFRDQYRMEVHFDHKAFSRKIDADKSLAVYRILQEALNNIGKHAQATEVFITLVPKEDSLLLAVEDDGVGFNYDERMNLNDKPDEGPLGLMIMKERAVLENGELRVESELGKGTHVIAKIPID